MTWFTIIAIFVLVYIDIVLVAAAVSLASVRQGRQAVARLDAIRSVTVSVGNQPTDVRRPKPAIALPWLDRLLGDQTITPQLNRLMRQAGLSWSAGKLVLLMLAALAAVALPVYLRTGAFWLAVLLGSIGGGAPVYYVFWKRSKRFFRFKELLPEALDSMVAAIRAGHSFGSALGLTARECMEPVRSEFRQCFDEQNFGLDLRTSLNNLEQRVPISDIRILVAAILIQRETGGNLTEILERVAYLIREEFRLHRQVRVHTAQGRLTGWILAILPPVLGFVIYLLNPKHMSLLWERPIGLKMLYGAAIMTSMGALIIRRIIRVRY